MNWIKTAVSTVVGALGSALISLVGGWDAGFATLCIFLAMDFVAGLVVAGVFKKSKKSSSGGLNSWIGWKGICKKVMTVVFVSVANRLDLTLGTSYIRTAVILAFISNETLSLVENAGLMGLPIPNAITNAIEALQEKAKDVKKED